MSDDAPQVTTMQCSMCSTQLPIREMRSFQGQIVCKACFDKSKTQTVAPVDRKSKLRLAGSTSGKTAVAWISPKGMPNICGLAAKKSVFFFADADPQKLEELAEAIGDGQDVEKLIPEASLVPLELISGAVAETNSSRMQIMITAEGQVQSVDLELGTANAKNQVFVELAQALGDRFTCQSQLAPDYTQMEKKPIVSAAGMLVVTVVGAYLANFIGMGVIVGGVGGVAFLGCLGWVGLAVYRTPKMPVTMSLRPTGK